MKGQKHTIERIRSILSTEMKRSVGVLELRDNEKDKRERAEE